jgi:hypothetical protein
MGSGSYLSAAGELFSHKGSATEDTAIRKIPDTATQKLPEGDLPLLLVKNFLGRLHFNDCSGFGRGCSGSEKQLPIFPTRSFQLLSET